jgi:F-type H+-transporting ATPase subunit delta
MSTSSIPKLIAGSILKITQGRNQIAYIEEIIHVLSRYVQRKKSEVVVYSAFALEPKTLENIKEIMDRTTGSNLSIKNIIDDSVIAGFVVKYQDSVYDFGVGSKLKQIQKQYGY